MTKPNLLYGAVIYVVKKHGKFFIEWLNGKFKLLHIFPETLTRPLQVSRGGSSGKTHEARAGLHKTEAKTHYAMVQAKIWVGLFVAWGSLLSLVKAPEFL